MVGIKRLLKDKGYFNPLTGFRYMLRMRTLVRDFNRHYEQRASAQRFVVVVAPWLGLGCPFYSLAFGLMLASDGNKVTFAINDLPFGGEAFRYRFILGCTRWVFKSVPNRHEVINLSAFRSGAALSDDARRSIKRLAQLNAVWALRGEMVEAGRERFTELCIRQHAAAYGAVAKVLQPGKYDVLFVPGGLYGDSGLWVEHARAAGMRVVSFDGGRPGTAMLAADGLACQLHDIPRAFAMLKERCAVNNDERQFVIEAALAEIGRRRAGTDGFASQMQNAGRVEGRFDGAVLLALNSSWDGAALGLHTVFQSNIQWIVETVGYLLEHTKALIVVRQHPAERFEAARTSDDYRALLRRNFGAHPRVQFIATNEPINSYDLLEQVAAVVVHTSTIGVEAAAHGKPAITDSNSYYSDLGFVWKGTDLKTYQSLLSDAAEGRLKVTPEMQRDADYCYYLTQCRNLVFTPFNAGGFAEWSRLSLDELHGDRKVGMMLKSIEENIPISFLSHLASLQSPSKAT
jgi:hypothetical protein